MSMNNLGLGFVFTARDMASATMTKVESRFKKLDGTTNAASKKFSTAVQRSVGGLAMVAGGAMALGGAMNLADQFGGFEKGLAKVSAITRASESDLEMLRTAAIKAGMETQFSPQEAIDALGELGARGFTAAEATNALGGALDFAAGGGIGIAQGASTVAAAIRSFGLSADDATSSADKLLKISNLTAIQSGDLELMLGTVARGAGATKQSLDEMLVSMGLVKNTGVDASVAASSVSSALLFMAQQKDAFNALGVEVTNADGTFRDMIDVVMETDAALKKSTSSVADYTAQATELFGRFGLTAFVGISNQINTGIMDASGNLLKGADAMAYLRSQMKDSAGAAAEFKNKMLDTYEGQKVILEGIVQTLGVVAGEMFAMVFKPMVAALSTAVTYLVAFFNAIPKPVKKVIGVMITAAIIGVMVAGAVIALAGAFSLAQMAVVAFAGPILAVVKVLALASAGGMALVGVFMLLRKGFDENIGGFGDRVRAVFEKVSLYFEAIGQLMSGDGKLRGDALKKLMDPANEGLLNAVRTFQMVKHRVLTFLQGIQEGFSMAFSTLEPVFTFLGDAITELFKVLGWGGSEFKKFTLSGESTRRFGESIGHTLAMVANIILHGLVFAIRAGTAAIKVFQIAWAVLRPFLVIAYFMFELLAGVLDVVASAFGMTLDAANETAGPLHGVANIVGYLVAGFLLWRGAMMVAAAATAIYRGVIMAATLAQAAFGAAAGASAMAILGPVGMAVAALAVGYAIGTWIDNMTGASDAISDWLLDITGVTAELEKLDEAYRKTIKTRGEVKAFESLEKAAEARGMSVDQFVNTRSSEIAQEQTAQRLGLSQDEIKRRLLTGEDVYKELTGPAPGADMAAGGIDAASTGEADKAKAAANMQADAFEQALSRAGEAPSGGAKPTKINATFKVDQQQLAQLIKDAEMQAGALDFEADLGGAGGF